MMLGMIYGAAEIIDSLPLEWTEELEARDLVLGATTKSP